MYITLLKVYYFFSFSAIAAGTFNWPMFDLLRNKDELLEWTVPAFKCDQKKEKEAWKVQCGISQSKGKYIVYEQNIENYNEEWRITVKVCWCQNKLFYVIAVAQ